MGPDGDVVVLVDPDGTARGTAPRATVHDEHTPLHLAFSCHLVDTDSRLLLTRRALTKKTWPGVWTNSFCGHPRPGESFAEAITRHARHELGIEIGDVRSLLPDFAYRAVDASGVVENEVCPVFVAAPATPVIPNPDEVMEYAWARPADVWTVAQHTPWLLSPWFVEQIAAIGSVEALLDDGVSGHGGGAG